MDIIFNDKDYRDEFQWELQDWCGWQSIPMSKAIIDMDENNVDGVDYFVITVNETIFSYLMYKEFDMTEKYGREGWNRWIEFTYNCKTA